MPFIISNLLKAFQWNYVILILAGLVLTCTIFGSFFRPLNGDLNERKSSYTNSDNTGWTVNGKDELNSEPGTVKSNCNSSEPPSYSTVLANELFVNCRTRISMPELFHLAAHNNRSTTSLNNIVNNENNKYKRTRTLAELCPSSRIKSSETSLVSLFKRPFQYDLLDKDINETEKQLIVNENDVVVVDVNDQKNKSKCDQMSIDKSPVVIGDVPVVRSSSYLAINKVKSSSSSSYKNNLDQISQLESNNSSNNDNIFSCFDLQLLTSPSFLLLALSGFLTLAGFFIPFMYIVDLAVASGYTKENGSHLLSIIGATNTIGRIFCGWISDKPKVDALFVNNLALIIGGSATIIAPIICDDFLSLAAYGSIFGFSIG